MPTGALSLADFPSDTIEIRCERCGRHDQYGKKRLLDRFGAGMGLPDLLRQLAPDCPVRSQMKVQSCGAIYPALLERHLASTP